jgi:hypothetical protein
VRGIRNRTMSKSGEVERARAALADLRAQLAAAEGIAPGRKTELLAELGDVERALTKADTGGRRPERLEQLALEFELSHPQAAELLNRLSVLLANMGI